MAWTTEDELKQAFRAILEKYGDVGSDKYDAIKDESKPPRRTLRRRTGMDWADLKAWAWDGKKPEEKPEEGRTYESLIAQTRLLKSNLEKSRDIAATIVDCCIAEIAKMRIKPVAVPKKAASGENLEFHTMRSDAQVGQFTDEAWTQGLARYDSDIYRERVQRLTEKIATFKQQDSSSLGLNKLVIYHLGDQVEGEGIFHGQAFALDLSGVEQLFFSVEVECSFILAMAGIFPEVEVYCVPGNHGRPGRKGDNHPKTNFDYVFYRIMQMTLKGQENVKFFISESPSMLIQQGRFVFLLNHGDTAKSWNGIPYYGLDRAAKKVNDLFGMIIHYNLCGHHHTPCNMADHIIMNGCLPGGSDFSVNGLLAASRPSQKIFYFHPQFGINRESNLYLADPVRLEADERGIFTSYV